MQLGITLNNRLNQTQSMVDMQPVSNRLTSTVLITNVDPALGQPMPPFALAGSTPNQQQRLAAPPSVFPLTPIIPEQLDPATVVAFHTALTRSLLAIKQCYPLAMTYEPLPLPGLPHDLNRNVNLCMQVIMTGEQARIFERFRLPFVPLSKRPPNYKHDLYHMLTNKIMGEPWVPHPLAQQELQTLRADSNARLQRIYYLEWLKSRIKPGVQDPRIEDDIFLSRLDYSVRFCRIFRFHDLPTEIKTNIFRYVAWSAPDIMKGVKARLWITWTCRSWRNLAIEDATIWNAVWFRDHPNFERSFEWLHRASNAPLDIRINDKKDHEFTAESMERLLDRVFTKLSNIRMLIVIVENWGPALAVLHKLRAVANNGIPLVMERFELHRHGPPFIQPGHGYQPPAYLDPIPLFGGAVVPSMRYFSTNAVHIDWINSHLANLTTLDIRRIPLERSPDALRFRNILSSCPGLQKLILDGAGPTIRPDIALGLPPIQLPFLKILVLANFSCLYGLYILPQISAPNILDLTLMDLTGQDYSPFFTFMTSKFPRVNLLTLWNVECSPWPKDSQQLMLKWLESMPSISYLRVARVSNNLLNLFLHTVPQTSTSAMIDNSVVNATMIVDSTIGDSPSYRAICPELNILECHHAADPATMAHWSMRKKAIGAPIKKIYIARKLYDTGKAYFESLKTITELAILPVGAKTEEEAEIHDL